MNKLDRPTDSTAAVMRELRRWQLHTKRLAASEFAGEFCSAIRGQGYEFEEVRAYQPGDDVRHIDWKVTARTCVPHVKLFREERERTVHLLIDVSRSMQAGSPRSSREVAAEVTALLTFAAGQNRDRIGMTLCSTEVERSLPAQRGSRNGLRLLRELLGHRARFRRTQLRVGLEHLERTLKRRSTIFVVSDFLDTDYLDGLKRLCRFHDLVAIVIMESSITAIPGGGLIRLEDLEAGHRITLDTTNTAARKRLSEIARQQRKRYQETMRAAGVEWIEIDPAAEVLPQLRAFFRTRARRGARR